MKTCPECGATDEIITFDADNDQCKACGKWFPAVEDVPTVYCHPCSVAGGAECAVYHLPPACKGDLMDEYTHHECCCFRCGAMVDESSNPDCSCETGPVYSRDVCKECPKVTFCDVPKSPQDYPHDDDCQCLKCREYNAEAVRP